MPVLESAVEKRVKEWADEHSILNVKFTPAQSRAYPDRMFFLPGGRPLLIELKREGEAPTKLQDYIIGQLKDRGYDVRWTDSAEVAIQWLARALDAAKRAAKGDKARPR